MARVRFLAPASDPREGKEGNVYGPLHEADFGDEDTEFVMTLWREGKVEILDTTGLTPPGGGATLPVISAVLATPDAADGTLASVTWDTDVPADSQVHYGLDDTYGTDSALDSTLTSGHGVSLTGLTAGTEYHYSAASSGASSPDATFTTITPEA